jgi:hypothetical protein
MANADAISGDPSVTRGGARNKLNCIVSPVWMMDGGTTAVTTVYIFTSSTRRFICRPSGVVFGATGLLAP